MLAASPLALTGGTARLHDEVAAAVAVAVAVAVAMAVAVVQTALAEPRRFMAALVAPF
jgi:hypothetical protein